jgi:hypothetical protein
MLPPPMPPLDELAGPPLEAAALLLAELVAPLLDADALLELALGAPPAPAPPMPPAPPFPPLLLEDALSLELFAEASFVPLECVD